MQLVQIHISAVTKQLNTKATKLFQTNNLSISQHTFQKEVTGILKDLPNI